MMEPLSVVTDVMTILRHWDEEHQAQTYDPVPALTRLAEIIEAETENYMKMDPDPFDERHPSRADPDCALGHILKVLFRKDSFMNKLVNDYLRDNYWSRAGNINKDSRKLNIAACRLMLDIMPGLETSAVFLVPEMESMILRLFSWAEKSIQPLQSYATGLLASAMEVQDIAANFREQNARLVPLMLQELHKLQVSSAEERQQAALAARPFAHLGHNNREIVDMEAKNGITVASRTRKRVSSHHKENGGFWERSPPLLSPPPLESLADSTEARLNASSPPRGIKRLFKENDEVLANAESWKKQEVASDSCVMSPPPPAPLSLTFTRLGPAMCGTQNCNSTPTMGSGGGSVALNECSNSSWAEMESYVIGNIQIYPPTLATRQMLILRYLTPMGEYQEFLSHVFEHNALELILKYTDLRESKDSRLAFEALKYLAALLCHKKFSIEFINMKGLQTLLKVPRPSVAATGVSICLYYLAYCEDAMERVCQLSHHIIADLVKYTLWLLECSHDSGRCHATMFFGLSFQFRAILAEFDAQDGLRKLYNVISTLPILSVEDDATLNDDEECAARQIVRHVCVALKRYLEAHLCIKAENLRRTQFRETGGQLEPGLPPAKVKSSPEEVQEQVQQLLDLMPFRSHWEPVDQLIRLGGVTLLLQIIAFAYEWNYSGRAETVRSALDVLAICSVMPRVQLLLCDRVDLPDEAMTVGMNIILGAAEGEIVADADVQRAALAVIINCVCAPIHRIGGTVGRFSVIGSAKKKTNNFRSSEELIGKMWESVRSNNGIMVLLQLMMVKTPITDADSIRALSCHALAGLARSETVRQIISKLPLFTNGQLQMLMRDPILQDKRQEHVSFQKSALELMERVSGKTKPSGNELEISLANMHRANVVAQTRIQFNDRQLLQLIQQHLVSRGLLETASALTREGGLPGAPIKQGPSSNFPPFSYRSNLTPPAIPRPRLSSFSPGASVSHHHHHRSIATVQNSSVISAASQLPAAAASAARSNVNPTTSQPQQSVTGVPPIRFNLTNPRKVQGLSSGGNCSSRSLQKQISCEQGCIISSSPLLKNTSTVTTGCIPGIGESHVTLDSIITEYLTNQHALCKNPMVPCPQFNLFEPHKCPDPKAKNSAPTNYAMRIARRSLALAGNDASRLDRKLVYSRFCPVRTFRLSEDDGFFTCCEFLPCDQFLMMGTYQGEVKMFNLHTGSEEATYQCHDSYVYHLQASRDRSLLLTSSTWRRPLSALWSINKFFEMKFALEEEEYVEFSKLNQDRIIGTKGEIATIYDVATGKKIMALTPQISNQYTKNRATYSPTDELVLSDGVLWDVGSGKEIHKLDKLNQTLSGVFHPNGLEVVSNTEVWDLRTFHLLRTVPALDQCQVLFSRARNVMYTVSLEQETEEDTAFESSFKTLDAYDYSSIATIDVKKNIYDLSCNKFDTQIAVVENQGMFDSVQESSVRLYDVGRRRDDEDEGEEDEDDEDMDGSEDGTASPTASEDEQHEDNAAGGNANAGGDNANENGNNGDDNNIADSNNEDDGDDIVMSDSDDDDDDDNDEDAAIISLSDSADTDELEDMLFA
ncbi:protein mahjong [Zootermopsis nevadensis]|uniref:DDB1- and CUL4-associated factor 1 n=1 Tax=Zootermopsis nevadensis TaxID=136037 RepID=A0A067RT01_ZOONE|nr:protein mahjong [Zootermopsis nevadensis]XP_021923770.1 protein mahjong [Zootermopsis nevadensis]KDR23940.1 Protein VPRBP [Zootermopsis nevadensis]